MTSVYTQAANVIDELLGELPYIPDRNCSCHISPPCSDCVDWSWLREVKERANAMTKLLHAHDLIDPSP